MPWTETDADGTTTTYDDLGRMVRLAISLGGDVTFSHDPTDSQTMTVQTLRDGTVTREIADRDMKAIATVRSAFTRDESGRVLTETRTTVTLTGEVVDSETGSFTYDADGNVLALEETDSAGTTRVKVTNDYDPHGALTRRITRTYDEDGNQTQAVRTRDETDLHAPTEKWRLAGTPWLPGTAMVLRPPALRRG